MLFKFNNLFAATVAGGITGIILGKDAGTLMMAAVITGCIIYNLVIIIRRKSV